MIVMRTTERPTHSVGEFVGAEQAVELHDPSLPMNPLRLNGVQPRALLREEAAHDPHPLAAPFDPQVVPSEPSPDLFGDMPRGVVPDEEQDFLAPRLQFLAAPPEELCRYGTDGSPVHEPYPHVVEAWKVESVAGDGLRVGVVLGDRVLDHAMGLPLLGEAAEGRQGRPAPPALVLEANSPLGVAVGHFHQSVASPFFLSYKGSGEVIHLFARIQRIPRRRESVARMVSPETRLWVRPAPKAASAAISKVQRLLSYPN